MTEDQFEYLIQFLIVALVIFVFFIGYSTGSRDND